MPREITAFYQLRALEFGGKSWIAQAGSALCALESWQVGAGLSSAVGIAASDIPGNVHLAREAQGWAFPGSGTYPVTAPSAKAGKATWSLNTDKCLLLNVTLAVQ